MLGKHFKWWSDERAFLACRSKEFSSRSQKEKELRKLEPLPAFSLQASASLKEGEEEKPKVLKSTTDCKFLVRGRVTTGLRGCSRQQQERNQGRKSWTNCGQEGRLPPHPPWVARRPVSRQTALLWESAAAQSPFLLSRVQIAGGVPNNAQFLPVTRRVSRFPSLGGERRGQRLDVLSRESTKEKGLSLRVPRALVSRTLIRDGGTWVRP